MHEITLDEMRQLLAKGRTVRQFAIDHYEELVARKHTYTLYGPYAHFLGASIPCNTVVPKRARKLMHKTRRKEYVIYELDGQYKVLRIIKVNKHPRVDVIYHHFELDGIVYAFSTNGTMRDGEISPFLRHGDANKDIGTEIQFLRFENGKPVSYGSLDRCFVFVQFYEYVDDAQMMVTTYRYTPDAKYSMDGYPTDPEAPVGAPHSLVHRRCYMEASEDTDFSRWFK